MKITNEKLAQVALALGGIASGDGSARLKYAVNMNRTLIEGALKSLEEVRTEPVGTEDEREKIRELEKEWAKLREATIFEDCLRNEDGSPVVNEAASFQFENNNAFQAKLNDLQRKKFPQLIEAQEKRDDAYQKLLKEEVDIPNFPYLIKWKFIDMDDAGRLIGLSGEEEFVLMSAAMFDGEPPWLDEDPQQTTPPPTQDEADDETGKD